MILKRHLALILYIFIPLVCFCQSIDRNNIAKADHIISSQPISVINKDICHSGNPHNYESLSIYWWPDPQNPQGPYIALDGQVNPDHNLYDYPRLRELVENLHIVAKAYQDTKEQKYNDFFMSQIDTWFIQKATRMAPNMDYSQFVPGRNNGKGNPQGLIDAYNFTRVIDEIEKVNNISPLEKNRAKALKKWFSTFAHWMETSPNGKTASQFQNNQAIAYETTLYRIHTFTGNLTKAQQHAIICIRHIKEQIDHEGKQPQELRRANPINYVNFNLSIIDYFLKNCPQELIDDEVITKVTMAKQHAKELSGKGTLR